MRLHDGKVIAEASDGGGHRRLNGSWSEPVNVLVRGGSIVPVLDTKNMMLTTTQLVQYTKIILVLVPN